jgi:hypothetical protein
LRRVSGRKTSTDSVHHTFCPSHLTKYIDSLEHRDGRSTLTQTSSSLTSSNHTL